MKNKIILAILLFSIFAALSMPNLVWADNTCHVSGYIWNDDNGNGMHDSDDEPTIAGAKINFLDASGRTVYGSDVTSEDGRFEISLSDGEYILQVILPEIYRGYGVRAADYIHGVLNNNADNISAGNEFLFEASKGRWYSVNIAALKGSDIVDMPELFNPSDDNSDNTEENGSDDAEESPSPSSPAIQPDTTMLPTSSPASSPNPSATRKPTDSSAAGGGGGGEATEKKPTPSPDPSATSTPKPTSTPRPTGTPDPDATAAPSQSPSSDIAVDENAPKVELNREDHFAYVSGYEDGTIRPENNITRQEVASLFFRLLTDEVKDYYYTKTNSFSDVSDLRWSNDAISTMAHAGVISGYEDGTFLPENNITRAEFATIAAKLDGGSYSGGDMFGDISGHWASAYINRAAQLGWISGYDGGLFKPDAYITRAEAMTIINNILVRHVEYDAMLAGMREWRDNTPDKWYYCVVQEATNSHYFERTDDGYNEIWTAFRDDKE